VLRACRRILRRGGRTAFYTIHPAPGLTATQRRRVSRDGPIAVAAPRPHREMLEAAGFTQIAQDDCTAEFAAIARAWIEQWDANHDELVALLGKPMMDERQAERRSQLRAIEDGVLCRSLFTARRPLPVTVSCKRTRPPGEARPVLCTADVMYGALGRAVPDLAGAWILPG
jgi:hypothetical protein